MTDLSPEQYFAEAAPTLLLDVRSPGEFAAGHIDGAVNLPLFSDAERAEVGTLYKQHSADAALLRGLDLVGPKMRTLIERARTAGAADGTVVQCWRGGQRSASVGWLLEQTGLRVRRLAGGYQAYRAYARRWLAEAPYHLRVLSGPTGSGKTEVLRALRNRGAAVLDLEALANHKGSSFGALGEAPQPTTEAFENRLFAELRELPSGTPLWVEDESRMIGTVCQPDVFYHRLLDAPAVELAMSNDRRVDHLVRVYSQYPHELLAQAFTRLRKKLGGQHLNTALEALAANDYATACRVALVYYDKAYAHYAKRRRVGPVATVRIADQDSAEAVADQLLRL